MKIFSAQQIYQADKKTIERQNITSLQLMERAACQAYKTIRKKVKKSSVIKVFCGVGNNGGDGLVIARKLIRDNRDVQVFVINYSNKYSSDFRQNLSQLNKISKTEIKFIDKADEFLNIEEDDIVIDAIFGIGLNRQLPYWVANLIDYINKSDAYKIAIDIPSGLFANKTPSIKEKVLKADLTLTFQCPKFVFFLPETYQYVGQLKVIDIGLDEKFLKETETDTYQIQKEDIQSIYQPRKRFSHKGTYGHCLVVGGSYGKMGSLILASKAALRIGAGKVTSYSPKCGYDILQTSIPEAMVLTTKGERILSNYESPNFQPETICFGVGVGTNAKTVSFFENLLKSTNNPLLIDADGLNILSKNHALINLIPENSVLTPHPKELERLIGQWSDSFDKLEKAKAFSHEHKLILVLKDAITLIVMGDKIYVNTTGNPGMATAGSGDVLSGIIAGLMAQGYSPKQAAIFGVYLHGLAGDMAVVKSSQETLIAGDIIRNFADALYKLKHRK